MHWLTKKEILLLQSKFEPERLNLIVEAIERYEGVQKTTGGTLVNSGEFDVI
jgi:hypothetical protein